MRRRWRREGTGPAVVEQASGARVAPVVRRGVPEAPAANSNVVRLRPKNPVEAALFDALELGERRAVVAALRDEIAERGADAQLLPLWNELAASDLPAKLTIGDLVAACVGFED